MGSLKLKFKHTCDFLVVNVAQLKIDIDFVGRIFKFLNTLKRRMKNHSCDQVFNIKPQQTNENTM